MIRMITARKLYIIAQCVSDVFPDAELSPVVDYCAVRFLVPSRMLSIVVHEDLEWVRFLTLNSNQIVDLGFGELQSALENQKESLRESL